MVKHDEAFSRGKLIRRVRRVERMLERFLGARGLESSSLSAEGLRIKDGGSIELDDGGSVTVNGGEVRVLDADGDEIARANVNGIAVDNGGLLVVYDRDNVRRFFFGDVLVGGVNIGTGMIARDETGDVIMSLNRDEIRFDFPGSGAATAQRISQGRWAIAFPDGGGTAMEVVAGELVVSGPGTRGVVLRVTEADGIRVAVDTDAAGVQSGPMTAGPADSAGAGFRALRIPN